MKSITLHNLDDELSQRLEQKAQLSGNSLNKTIKQLLESSLGINSTYKNQKRKELSKFCGIWDDKDVAEFDKATEDFEKIDEEDWK